ncbi:hypothetical protein JCM8097_001035 [Rhodosporidiobolus ruineniae]
MPDALTPSTSCSPTSLNHVQPSRPAAGPEARREHAVAAVYCFCDRKPRIEAVLRTVRKDNENYGRGFFSCESPADRCNFFLWEDALEATAGKPYLPTSAGAVVPYEEPNPSKKKKTPVKKASSSKSKSMPKSQGKGKKRRVVSSSEEEEDETESDYEARDRTPSPPRRRGGRRLADSPSPSDLALVGTSTGSTSGGGARNRKKPRREPSPDWPDPDEQEEELRRKDREIAALRRQVAAAEEVAKKAKDEAREKRVENEGLVKQLYPGIWCGAHISPLHVDTD